MELEDTLFDLEDSPLSALTRGSSVLVRGPAMSGKYDLTLRLLAAAGERRLLVSTDDQVGRVRPEFATYGDPETLGVVDCATRLQADSRDDDGDDPYIRYASSPQNLTEVGVKFTDLVETMEAEDVERVAVGVHSLSTLLMYWEPKRIYQFVRVLVNQSQGLGWPTVAVLDDAATDDQTVNTLTQPFDLVIDTRATDDGNEYRVRGAGYEPTDWTPF